jgi:UDP-N-acetyl-D-mannosaminuronic acid dehydrogenase
MSADVCVIGLGVVGLPLAVSFARAGSRVVGVDADAGLLATLDAPGRFPHEPGLDAALDAARAAGALSLAGEPTAAAAYVIAASPRGPDDLARIVEALPLRGRGELVVVESTCAPGWVRDGVVGALTRAGRAPGVDVHVAHAPERVAPGRALEDLRALPRVVGGFTPACAERARELYATICDGELSTSDLETAALSKLAENAFRAVNVALADELADLTRAHGVDPLAMLELANTHPRVGLHRPGLGAWGRCLPLALDLLDPAEGTTLHAARLGRQARPARAAALVARALEGVASPRVALFGVTYKADVSDTRNAPAEAMLAWWRTHTPYMDVRAHDPVAASWPHAPLVSPDDALEGAHALVVTTPHDAFARPSPELLAAVCRVPRVFDFHGVLRQHLSSQPDLMYVGPGVLADA